MFNTELCLNDDCNAYTPFPNEELEYEAYLLPYFANLHEELLQEVLE